MSDSFCRTGEPLEVMMVEISIMEAAMAPRKKASDYKFPGLDLDYRPFKRDDLLAIAEKADICLPILKDDSWDAVVRRFNDAAIMLKYHRAAGQAPTLVMLRRTLDTQMSACNRLRDTLPVFVEEDVGLAPGACNPHVSDQILSALGPEVDARLSGTTPITNLEWYYAGADGGRDDSFRPECTLGESEQFFGARGANDFLVNLSNSLAVLVDAACAKRSKLALLESDRASNTPVKDLADDLIKIYCELFDREPAASRNSNTNTPGGPLIRFLRACLELPDLAEAVEPPPSDETLYSWIRDHKAGHNPL